MSSFQNACYTCAHRRELIYSTHSECAHPDRYREAPHFISRVMNSGVASESAGKEADRLGPSKAQTGVHAKLNIEAVPYAVRCGWFAWPVNFDPVWLLNCDGFTPKVTNNG